MCIRNRLGGQSMLLPLVAIATAVIPDLIKIIVGDREGRIADAVADVVTEVTGTADPEIAQQKIQQDPAIAAALRVKLAELSLKETELQNKKEADQLAARMQAENSQREHAFAVLREQFENDQRMRAQQFAQQRDQIKSAIEQTASARALQLDLISAGGPIKWAPVGVSVIVTVLFAGTLLVLLLHRPEQKTEYGELINICIGALVAGFSTVISFWLGSSQGSREKDTAVQQMQATQATQATKQIDIVARQAEIIRASDGARPRHADEVVAPAFLSDTGARFDTCLTLVLGAEGGFSNHARDPGGATNFGITIDTLREWRRSRNPDAEVTVDDVRKLKIDEAKEIYRSRYWNIMRCDRMPKGVDLVLFDFGVNAGPGRAVRTLQDVLAVKPDGSVGPVTLNGLNASTPEKIIRDFSAKRHEFHRNDRNFDVFGSGWTHRTDSMQQAALRMAAS